MEMKLFIDGTLIDSIPVKRSQVRSYEAILFIKASLLEKNRVTIQATPGKREVIIEQVPSRMARYKSTWLQDSNIYNRGEQSTLSED